MISNLGTLATARVSLPLEDTVWFTWPVTHDLFPRHLPFSDQHGLSSLCFEFGVCAYLCMFSCFVCITFITENL